MLFDYPYPALPRRAFPFRACGTGAMLEDSDCGGVKGEESYGGHPAVLDSSVEARPLRAAEMRPKSESPLGAVVLGRRCHGG